jgi:beta-glucanase (GH16 family)
MLLSAGLVLALLALGAGGTMYAQYRKERAEPAGTEPKGEIFTQPHASQNRPPKGETRPQPQTSARLLIDEQFDGTSLDPDRWEAMTLPRAYRNDEEQSYDPSQVSVADGMLRITATRTGPSQWRSGEVHSKWAYTYGDFEVRMRISAGGQGVWPAAWLMGTTGEWPVNGEIDIMENINGSPTVHGTIHGGGSAGHWQLQHSAAPIDVTAFHTYKISKRPGAISWWVDGIKRGEWTQSQTPAGGTWPFESHNNFALLNLAIGGNWPGASTDQTPDTIVMYVDAFTVSSDRPDGG